MCGGPQLDDSGETVMDACNGKGQSARNPKEDQEKKEMDTCNAYSIQYSHPVND